MHLQSSLSLKHTTVDELSIHPAEDNATCVLTISAPISPSVAELLGRKSMLFDSKGVARSFEGSIRLGVDLETTEIIVSQSISADASALSFKPLEVCKLSVQHANPGSGDHTLVLKVHVHTKDHFQELVDFVRFINKGEFETEINPLQDKLFENKPDETEAIPRKSSTKKKQSKK